GVEVYTTVRVWRVGTLGSQVAMALLNTITVTSGDASESDTTSFALSGYTAFEIVLENVVPTNNSVKLQLQVQQSATFPSTVYVASQSKTDSSGATANTTDTTCIPLSYDSNLFNAAPGISGSIRVSNPGVSGKHQWWGDFVHAQASGVSYRVVTGGYYDTTGTITGIRIIPSASTLASGKIRVYGIP